MATHDYMGLSENSIAPNEADRLYPESVGIEIASHKNSLDFLDSFSVMARGFEFSDRPVSDDVGAADLVLETEVANYVMALFEDDEEAEALAEGIMDGFEREELLSLFDGDVTRHETVRKRFRRKVSAHPELRSMIHGK